MVFNAPHIHLIINHLPIFAITLAIPLLLISLWRLEEKGIFLGATLLLVITGLGGLGALLSGHEAAEVLEGQAGVSMRAMATHEELAEITAWLAGALALAALYLGLRALGAQGPTPRLWIMLLLAGAVIGSGMAGWTSLKGGLIRHPEIRPPEASLEEFMEGGKHEH